MRKTIQSRLLLYYCSLIFIIVIGFVIYFYIYFSNVLNNKAYTELLNTSKYIATGIDTEVKNIDKISMQIAYSNSINELFFTKTSELSDLQRYYNEQELQDIEYSIAYPWLSTSRISIFDNSMEGRFTYIGAKANNYELYRSYLLKTDYIDKAIKLNGQKLLSLPYKDYLGDQNVKLISLFRSFDNKYGIGQGIIQIDRNYNFLSKIIDDAAIDYKDINPNNIYILNENGQVIYPENITNQNEINSYWNMIKNTKDLNGKLVLSNDKLSDKNIAGYSTSEYTRWTSIVVESEKVLLRPVNTFKNNLLLVGVVLLFLTLSISYVISRKLTIPIKNIHKSIMDVNLNLLSSVEPINANNDFDELEQLNSSFREMVDRLKNSLDEVVLYKSKETEARMIALQAQMGPHFLYNTLTTMHVMAEESNQNEIAKMCSNLSRMLRYVLSDSSTNITIEDEMNYAKDYLELMKIRYGDFLNYSIDVPEELKKIIIPKLIIQPIVENTIKYGLSKLPPWQIDIKGTFYENSWMIEISDNGNGFNKVDIDDIMNNIKFGESKVELNETKSSGMGLKNTYLRLKILYEDEVIFNISNKSDGGAVVKLGGSIIRNGGIKVPWI